jgi:adenylate cyclase
VPDQRQRNLVLIAAGLIFLLLLETMITGFLSPLENRLSDSFVRKYALTLEADPDILILDIDEKSLAEMSQEAGRYPWPRSVYAELLEGLDALSPRAIVFDILFTDPDLNNIESDAYFNEVLGGMDNVYLPFIRLDEENDARYGIPLDDFGSMLGFQQNSAGKTGTRVGLALPDAIAPEHWRLGLINFNEDEDGVGRSYWVSMPAYDWNLPSLPARVAYDLGSELPDKPSIRLFWRGDKNDLKHYSFSDIYSRITGASSGGLQESDFRDKIILIGTSATGLHDLRVTPIDNLYPGVEILATALSNLKNEEHYYPAPSWTALLFGSLLILTLLAIFSRSMHLPRIIILMIIITVVTIAASYLALRAQIILLLLTPLLFGWLFFLGGWFLYYLEERRIRMQTINAFKRTMDPRVVEKLVQQGMTMETMQGESRIVTVLFSDIRGFTSLSEKHSAEEVVSLLNRYFSMQVDTIFKHGGTLDKFIGDAIMAFWGAPTDDPEHACRAINAALEMTKNLKQFQQELKAEGIEFDIGIGLHTGNAVVGFIGSDTRKDYTIIGDTVNLASRLEGLTKGIARVLISEETRNHCQNRFVFKDHGAHQVKGREEAVHAYEPGEKE